MCVSLRCLIEMVIWSGCLICNPILADFEAQGLWGVRGFSAVRNMKVRLILRLLWVTIK
jgi:hypothetical protein